MGEFAIKWGRYLAECTVAASGIFLAPMGGVTSHQVPPGVTTQLQPRVRFSELGRALSILEAGARL